MSVTTLTFDESLEATLSEVDLTSRRPLCLLLEAMEQNDLPARDETEDQTINVGLALAT